LWKEAILPCIEGLLETKFAQSDDYKPQYLMFMLLDSIWLREVYLPHKKNVEDVYIWTTHTFKSSQRHEELELCHAGDAIVALNSLELYLEEKKTLIKLFRFDENETD
jgi:hypothetical protein